MQSTSASSIDGSEAQKKGNADGSSASKRGQPLKEGGSMSSTERSRKHREKRHPKKIEEDKNRDRLRKQKARENRHPKKIEEDKNRDRLRMQKVRSGLTFEEKARINAKRREARRAKKSSSQSLTLSFTVRGPQNTVAHRATPVDANNVGAVYCEETRV